MQHVKSKVLYIFGHMNAHLEELVSQLSKVHIECKVFDQLSRLIAEAEKWEPTALLIEESNDIIELFEKLSDLKIPRLLMVTEDRVDSRLLAARLNVDGYYIVPVDYKKLISQIDQLLFTFNGQTKTRVLLAIPDVNRAQYHIKNLNAHNIDVIHIMNANESIEALRENSIDAIIADQNLGEYSGVELASMIKLHDQYSWIPAFILADSISGDLRVAAARRGPIDILPRYIQGPALAAAVDAAVVRNRLMSGTQLTDSLTRLYNLVPIKRLLEANVERALRAKMPLSVVIFDLDNFKRVNDDYSYSIGDRVIVKFSDILRAATRKFDLIGRYGGEKFAMVMPITDCKQAYQVVERIRNVWNTVLHKTTTGLQFKITFSAGICQFDESMTTADMLAAAEYAVVQAKLDGRNTTKRGKCCDHKPLLDQDN